MSRVLIILADGFEEMEAIAPIDLLRRAGMEVLVAGWVQPEITGRNGLRIIADVLYESVSGEEFDLIVLPGGPGHAALRADAGLLAHLQRHASAGRPLAAICAAPTVLHDAGLLKDHRYTGHFSIEEEIGPLENSAVVSDRGIITSRGAGTATRFGLALIEHLKGVETAQQVAESICFEPGRPRDSLNK